jgi:hypothetical protein
MNEHDEYTIDAIVGKLKKKKFAVSLYFEKPIPAVEGVGPLTVHRFLITHTCEAINEKEALGNAIWTHNYTPDNGHLRLWQVAMFGANPIETQVMERFREKGKIPAIKRYRELTGTTLKEAKAVVDEWQVKHRVDHMGNALEQTGSI